MVDVKEQELLTLKVKTLSEKPIRVEIAPTATVGELKEMIKAQANAEGKFLRLIHQVRMMITLAAVGLGGRWAHGALWHKWQGKMLSEDKAMLASFKIKSEDFIHCAISAAVPKAVVAQVRS